MKTIHTARRYWRDERGLEMVESLAMIAIGVALLLATMVVFQQRGGNLGSAATAAFGRFIAGGSATTSQPAAANPAQTISSLAAAVNGVPSVMTQHRSTAQSMVAFASIALTAIGLTAVVMQRRTVATNAAVPTGSAATPWWQTAWGWLQQQWEDAKQVLADPGFWAGLAVGIALTAAAVVLGIASAPVWVVVLVAVGIGALTALVGTLVSNAAAGRPLTTDLLQNTVIGAAFGLAGLIAVAAGPVGLVVAGVTAAAGSILANVLTGQRWDKALLVNVVLAVMLAFAAERVLPSTRDPATERPRTTEQGDTPDERPGRMVSPCAGVASGGRVPGLAAPSRALCAELQQMRDTITNEQALKEFDRIVALGSSQQNLLRRFEIMTKKGIPLEQALLDRINGRITPLLEQAIRDADAHPNYRTLTPEERAWLDADRRHRELAVDPDKQAYSIQEAQAALQAEQEGILPGPVRRDISPESSRPQSSGGDIIDGNGRVWDVKLAKPRDGTPWSEGVSRERAQAIIQQVKEGENILVDTTGLTSEQVSNLKNHIREQLPSELPYDDAMHERIKFVAVSNPVSR